MASALVAAAACFVSESEPTGLPASQSFIRINVQSPTGTMGAQTPMAVWALMPRATNATSVTFSTNYKGAFFATTGNATDVVRPTLDTDTSKVIASTLLIVGDTLKTATIADTQSVLVRATVGAAGGSPGFSDTTTVKFVPSPPSIILSPDSTAFLLVDTIPSPQTVAVVDGGVAALTGISAGSISFGHPPAKWLTAVVTGSSTAPAVVTLTIAKGTDTLLTPGTYTATVPIMSTARGIAGVKVLRVTLVVAKPNR
jgi:hypothetical protein